MSDIILHTSHLTKRFGSFAAVDDISFAVRTGEIVGLLGPNGAGKSTTIFMLLDLITPTSGNISIFGWEYKTDRERILQQLNYSSTYVEMAPRLTVFENMTVMAMLYRIPDARNTIIRNMKKFGVSDFAHKRHDDLSQGQKTRVYLCKAFLNNPKLLLLDEPTASLDPDVASVVRKEILDARKQGMTILLTSHNMAEVEEVCDRVLFVSSGKIVAEDTPDKLARKVRKVRVHFMIRDGQKRTVEFARKSGFDATAHERYVTISVDERDISFLLNGLAELGVDYSEISIDKPTLQDYFVEVTKGRIIA